MEKSLGEVLMMNSKNLGSFGRWNLKPVVSLFWDAFIHHFRFEQ
jgi:hypothetical protein